MSRTGNRTVNRTVTWGATVFGIGLLPGPAGTWGSLAACLLALPLAFHAGSMAGWILLAATVPVFFAGVKWAGAYAAQRGRADPREVVIDEVAGQWLALVPVASLPHLYPVAFVAFRLFDIVKPWPVSRLERLPGGMGIMADDIAAGAGAALVSLAVGMAFWPGPG